MPASLSGDGIDHSLFASFAKSLNQGGVATLAIGKPGVDFFQAWDLQKWFYDRKQYDNTGWQDLVDNLHDAVEKAKTLPCVDPRRISILGHSEGTQVAIDFATRNPSLVKTLILVGFAGENLAETVDWQLFRRPIDLWIAPDADEDGNGKISRDEAKKWPEFRSLWQWEDGVNEVSFAEMEKQLRANPNLQQQSAKLKASKVWEGVYHRPPIYEQAVRLSQTLLVFTGEADVRTRPQEAIKLGEVCAQAGKSNCKVNILPGLCHAMSLPREPRRQPYLDETLGPVSDNFARMLKEAAEDL